MSSAQLLPEAPFGPQHFIRARSPRVYDYLLGGHEHYACDREAATAVCRTAEWVVEAARINRDFALRSVQVSLDLGVRQFLDLGCGLPGARDVHQVAEQAPGSTTVYVDRDYEVYLHTALRPGGSPSMRVIHADLLAMDQLLASDAVGAALDRTRPVAVLLHDVLPWCGDDTAVHAAMATLRAWMPPGSTLSITHLTDHWHRATMPDAVAAYASHGLHVRPRCQEEIAELFADFDQQGLGLTATGCWHSSSRHTRHVQHRLDVHSAAFAGIAVKPSPGRNPPARSGPASRPA
ncbi:SAM-dependent methyltransferase [Streptomyces sp. NPDC007083]|uniref:SAM-dependent methyltransferase n=1 Tax=Streptomyces sp. NPDC007083 TaxID=3156913 RepID=UPI0033D3E1C3